MATNDESLEMMEAQIRERAEVVKLAQLQLTEAQGNLADDVEKYQRERKRLQREYWAKAELGWCQRCRKFFLKDKIKLLYSEGMEWHGSHGYESHDLYKRVRSLCAECAEYSLSRPRGGKEEFQCFKAEKRGEDFFIFVSGAWKPLQEPKRVKIEIEREYISEGEYCFGKPVHYDWYPRVTLTIGGEEVI